MPADWVFPRQVRTGAGALESLPELIRGFGTRAYVVTGKSMERAASVVSLLESVGMAVAIARVDKEPTVEDAQNACQRAREFDPQVVVAIGGGSALDLGKAVAGLLANPGNIFEYLEVVGAGKPLSRPSLPFVAIPTTAGTGSEATRNAVLGVEAQRVKVSLRSPYLVPWAAILDPVLTVSLPPEHTVASGLDAFTQLLEAFVCRRANALTDAVCREGLRRAAQALPAAVEHPDDLEARMDMLYAAFFSGVALANAGLGAVHGFAGPLGGMLGAPHGFLCAALLPPVVEVNVRALRERAPDSPALARYAEVAALVTGRGNAVAEDLVDWLKDLSRSLRVPTLAELGFHPELLAEAIEKARKASSMKANPIDLSPTELEAILALACECRQ